MAAAVLPSSHMRALQSKGSESQAASLLALLQEDDDALKEHALRKLHALVDAHWPEVCEYLSSIESLSEDSAFPGHSLASAIASICYYHLEAYPDAVRCALAAGSYFDPREGVDGPRGQYIATLITCCIDEYSHARSNQAPISPRLEEVVNQMFERCITDGRYKQALGVACECLRLDVITSLLSSAISSPPNPDADADSTNAADLLSYTIELVTGGQVGINSAAAAGLGGVSLPRAFRTQVLRALARFYTRPGQAAAGPSVTDHAALARVLQALDDADELAALLLGLVEAASGPTNSGANAPEALLAYQIGLDAVENENQTFLLKLYAKLPANESSTESSGNGMDADASTSGSSSSAQNAANTVLDRLRSILDGSLTAAAYMDFMSHKSAADRLILKTSKDGVDARNSVLHNALVVSHSYMYCGTSIDSFLRDNLDWLARASNWNKFSASASQGVVHKGRLSDAMRILDPYLPREGDATADPYAEGGALLALGLIHANRGAAVAAGVHARPGELAGAGARASAQPNVMRYLSGYANGNRNEVIQHGACLGVGCAAMATGDEEVFSTIRALLYTDEAVAAEGAALGVGLLLTGRGPEWKSESAESDDVLANELLAQAHDTEHDKVIRAIGMALALMCYAQEDAAEVLITQLMRDKDAILRYGGMFAIGLAYVGTGSNAAVKRLLHVAVSDVSDDVRRAAVMALGFVLCRQWREVPTLVQQLAESYNPHVRYGAAMAVGIACAGSGLPDAVGLLEPLADDSVDYVRQAALLALGLVLQQESGAHLPKATEIRTKLSKLVADKHTGTMTKMGAILSQGIMDIGGRNAITSMVSRGGFVKQSAVVGMAMWLQHWYWYPLLHFLSLAVSPTPLIGLVGDFRVPKDYKVICQCRPSWFAYPPALEEKKEDKSAKVTTVELSITAKAKAKAAAKEKAKGTPGRPASGMEVDDSVPKPDAPAAATGASESKTDGETKPADAPAAEAKKEEKEATSFPLPNMSRVTLSQTKFLDFDAAETRGQRYVPVRTPAGARLGSGILLLVDTQPEAGEDANLVPIAKPSDSGSGADDGPEASPPEIIEWLPGEYY